VGHRQEHERRRVSTLVDLGEVDEAGLAIRMDERSHYEVAVHGDRVMVKARMGPWRRLSLKFSVPTGTWCSSLRRGTVPLGLPTSSSSAITTKFVCLKCWPYRFSSEDGRMPKGVA
jgi:hypothetical protein